LVTLWLSNVCSATIAIAAGYATAVHKWFVSEIMIPCLCMTSRATTNWFVSYI